MKKLIALIAIVASLTAGAQGNWSIDNAHTSVRFSVTHMMVSQVEGRFNTFNGTVSTTNDDFTDAKIDITVDVNSINTANTMRDNHLKGEEFFNAEKYPEMKFKSMTLKKVSGNKYVLEGNLTIRDVTKPVTLDVIYNGTVKNPNGATVAGFHVTGSINRFDFNLKWNKLAEAGPVVSKDVALNIDIELKKM
jgi:polyisoprenoid-binding protein YceI